MVTVKKSLKAVCLMKPYAKEPDTEAEEDGDRDEEEEEEEEEDAYKEGEDEEEEEEMTDRSCRISVVGDLPLDVQGFRQIHDQGPQGITMPVCSHQTYTVLPVCMYVNVYVCVCVCLVFVILCSSSLVGKLLCVFTFPCNHVLFVCFL